MSVSSCEQPIIQLLLPLACRVLQYARYVDGLKVAESEPGCEQCEDNRLILEKAWQVVSSEFFDPHGEFSQAKWVAALKSTLQVRVMFLKIRWGTQCSF